MKELLQTHSVSYAQGLQLGLEAQGIPATVLDENAPGYLGFAGRVRLVVLEDGDFDRAMAFIRQFEARPHPMGAPPSWKVQKRGLLVGALGFVVLVSALGFGQDRPTFVNYALFVAGIILMVTGATLVVIVGPRRDRQDNVETPPPS